MNIAPAAMYCRSDIVFDGRGADHLLSSLGNRSRKEDSCPYKTPLLALPQNAPLTADTTSTSLYVNEKAGDYCQSQYGPCQQSTLTSTVAFRGQHNILPLPPPFQQLTSQSSVGPMQSQHLPNSLLALQNFQSIPKQHASSLFEPISVSVSGQRQSKNTGNLLHRICASFGTSGSKYGRSHVELVLKKDPEALVRSQVIFKIQRANFGMARVGLRTKAAYRYPLHLALANRYTPVEVIRCLLNAATKKDNGQSLSIQDGPMNETPLLILIKRRPEERKLLDDFLMACPRAASLHDRHQNTCLHIACQYGAPFHVIRHLALVHPQACRQMNMHGLTPLHIAQQRTDSDEQVVNFLQIHTTRFIYKGQR